MAALVEYYGGAVTWSDYDRMPYRDLRALEDRMAANLRRRADGGLEA